MIRETEWFFICGALAAGEAGGFYWPEGSSLRFAALTVFVLVVLFGYGCALPKWNVIAAFLLGLTLSWGSVSARALTLNHSRNHGGAPLEVELTVGERVTTRRDSAGVRWVSFPSQIGTMPVRVIFPSQRGQARPRPGERWRCAGWLARGGGVLARTVRTFWVDGRGTFAHRCAAAPAWSPGRSVTALRHDLSERVGIGLGHDPLTADLNRAILLGERARVPPDTRNMFAAAGTLHIFAISGLHVMVIAGFLSRLLQFAFLPTRCQALVLVPCLWAHVWMIGMPPSAIRAALMASFYFSASLFWRRPNGMVAWALAFLAVHVLTPLSILNVGSLFSFAVMFALVTSGRVLRPLTDGWRKALAFSAVAWAAGVPIAASVFAHVTPGGLLANVILVPTAALSVRCSAGGILASYLWHPLAAHVNNLAALMTRAMVGVSRAVASLPGSDFSVVPWGVAECVAWYAALGLCLLLAHLVLKRHAGL